MPIHQYLYIFTLLLFAFGCTSNEINLSKESETTQIDTTTPIHKKDVLNNMDRVAKWQMAHPIEGKEKRIHKLNWLYGVFYMGLYDYYTISKEMASIEEINQVGQQYEWRLRQDYFNADRLAIGQVFLDVYQSENQSLSAVNNILPQLDTIMAKNTHSQDGNPRLEKEDFWSWADALFMGPGAYARAYSITKDEKYLDYIAQQWALSKGVLYSTKDSLYYRDRGAKEESTPQKQIFWGRGNGWAIGGMVRVLAAFDEPNKLHDQIIPQYKEMAYKVLRLQQADGLWRTDLENPNFHKVGESSASSLFLYALAWGVNEGVLPKEAFYPSIIKGWKALQENVNEAGRLGNVQLVASAPGRFKASDWNNYASGAYLLAGTQVYKLLENTPFTDDYPNQSTYIQSLQKFPQYVNTGFDSAYQGNPELGVLGCADHEEEASRTNGNLVLTYATMFNSPLYDPSVSGESKADLLEKCKKVIRYMCATHKSGSVKCSDGMQWGRKWQSSWWTSRMVMGAHMVKDHLSNEEWDDVMRVLKSEADTLLNRPVPIRLVGNTSCEENAWETEVLSLAYLLLKDHPDRDAWLEKMNVFAMNTFSTSSSMTNTTLLEGKAVNDWILGPVIYDDLTIENHYAFHICYMASPLLSLSWTKYIWNHFGEEFPNTLAYRERDVYEKFMNYALWDGRVAYVGAKDWPRYIYGLFFIMPALVNQQHLHQDQEARLLEQQRFYTFAKEQELHGNGSYFGDRIIGNGFCRRPPEWETDVAACLAMSYLMHEAYDTKVKPAAVNELSIKYGTTTYSTGTKHALTKDENRFVACGIKANPCWNKESGPTFLFSPKNGEHALEWNGNMLPSFRTEGGGYFISDEGKLNKRIGVRNYVLRDTTQLFEGGFVSMIEMAENCLTKDGLVYGKAGKPNFSIKHQNIFVALPDGETVVKLDRSKCVQDNVKIVENKGFGLKIPNDIFNDSTRTYFHQKGKTISTSFDQKSKDIALTSNWISVDGIYTIYLPNEKAGTWRLHDDNTRKESRFDINKQGLGSLLTDKLYYPFQTEIITVPNKGVEFYKEAYLLSSGKPSKNIRFSSSTKNGITTYNIVNKKGEKYCMRESTAKLPSFKKGRLVAKLNIDGLYFELYDM